MKRERICSFCNGTGHRPVNAITGRDMRRLREAKQVEATDVANALGVTSAYICYLEQGKRNWTPKLKQRFKSAVERLSQKSHE